MGQSLRTNSSRKLSQTRHGIFNSITTIQTTEQWEDRGIPQVPKGMHWQAHQPRIGMG